MYFLPFFGMHLKIVNVEHALLMNLTMYLSGTFCRRYFDTFLSELSKVRVWTQMCPYGRIHISLSPTFTIQNICSSFFLFLKFFYSFT